MPVVQEDDRVAHAQAVVGLAGGKHCGRTAHEGLGRIQRRRRPADGPDIPALPGVVEDDVAAGDQGEGVGAAVGVEAAAGGEDGGRDAHGRDGEVRGRGVQGDHRRAGGVQRRVVDEPAAGAAVARRVPDRRRRRDAALVELAGGPAADERGAARRPVLPGEAAVGRKLRADALDEVHGVRPGVEADEGRAVGDRAQVRDVHRVEVCALVDEPEDREPGGVAGRPVVPGAVRDVRELRAVEREADPVVVVAVVVGVVPHEPELVALPDRRVRLVQERRLRDVEAREVVGVDVRALLRDQLLGPEGPREAVGARPRDDGGLPPPPADVLESGQGHGVGPVVVLEHRGGPRTLADGLVVRVGDVDDDAAALPDDAVG